MKTCSTTAAAAMLLQLLWAGTSRAHVIALDPRDTVLSMAANDRLWAPHLNVDVRVKKSLLKPAALAVLQQVEAVGSGGTSAGKAKSDVAAKATAGTVMVNALIVVVEVACSERYESDQFDFAMAVAASAVKCRVLPYVLVQAKAMGHAKSEVNMGWPLIVRRTLSRYLNKMGRMRDSLRLAADLHRTWEEVVQKTKAPNKIGNVGPFVTLAEAAVTVMCSPDVMTAVHKELGMAGGPENWKTVAEATAAFDGAQKLLDQVLDGLPITSIDQVVWDVFLDGTENAGAKSTGG